MPAKTSASLRGLAPYAQTIARHAPFDLAGMAGCLATWGDVAIFSGGGWHSGWSYVALVAPDVYPGWLPAALDADDGCDAWSHVPRWVGVLPYEAGRHQERREWSRGSDSRFPSPWVGTLWRRVVSVVAVDHTRGQSFVVSDDKALRHEIALAVAHQNPSLVLPWQAQLVVTRGDEAEHMQRICQALALIAQGDLYQVNLARRLSLDVKGSWLEGFRRLVRAAPAPYTFGASFDGRALVASSPELFLRITANGIVWTAPIKGTRPRGAHAAADRLLRSELAHDAKEDAELVMVIDHARNDLGRWARSGSVRVPTLPRIETYRTLHHRLADVTARLRPDADRSELVATAFPAASVTGAPKVRAMEVIAQLEPHRRGIYTGAFGYQSRGGELVLAMAIRTLTLGEGGGHYFTGGGIVDGSDPEREVAETNTKAMQLRALLGA